MTESDDPVTAVIVAGSVAAIGTATGVFGGGGDTPDIPAVRAESTAKTAKRVEPVTDLDKRNRRRAASIFTSEGFATPKLAKPGLLGLGV